jgi:AraC-like DNA-binding protein
VQEPAARSEERIDPGLGPARGVIKGPVAAGNYRHARCAPPAPLAAFVAHYWMVSWEVDAEEYQVESLPHPNVHLICEGGDASVYGVSTSRFTRILRGRSHVFGIKFTPGAFRVFSGRAASSLANTCIPAREIFGAAADALALAVEGAGHEDAMVAAANHFLLERLPAPEEPALVQAAVAAELVARILAEPGILTVDDLALSVGMNKRGLQRLFHEYVGASPKWVIRRYRLHELLERAHAGEPLDWPALALDLGYFDQAHMINDFRSIMGRTPEEYRKQAAG